jgi:RNA polymerase sigma-70 factor (ECF subfamily)
LSLAPDTDRLLELATDRDATARGVLLERHRTRLRRMVAVRIDPRLASRIDPSDVVQEVLVHADRRLDAYLERRPIPFYPWLRQLAADRLVDLHRHHIRAARRTIDREAIGGLPDHSGDELAGRLVARGSGPSEMARRAEGRDRVHSALKVLSADDREILILRFLEELPAREVAAVVGVTEVAAKQRVLRALKRLRTILDRGTEDS